MKIDDKSIIFNENIQQKPIPIKQDLVTDEDLFNLCHQLWDNYMKGLNNNK